MPDFQTTNHKSTNRARGMLSPGLACCRKGNRSEGRVAPRRGIFSDMSEKTRLSDEAMLYYRSTPGRARTCNLRFRRRSVAQTLIACVVRHCDYYLVLPARSYIYVFYAVFQRIPPDSLTMSENRALIRGRFSHRETPPATYLICPNPIVPAAAILFAPIG
jgi:hypothetical protein